jgi:putative pyruvate formate lyase activating enzyme
MIRPAAASQSIDPRFLLEPFEPAHFALDRAGQIALRVVAELRDLEDCCACPRNCLVKRTASESNICHSARYARVASAFPHFGEEDCYRGWSGSCGASRCGDKRMK